jgi:hypothetical protein
VGARYAPSLLKKKVRPHSQLSRRKSPGALIVRRQPHHYNATNGFALHGISGFRTVRFTAYRAIWLRVTESIRSICSIPVEDSLAAVLGHFLFLRPDHNRTDGLE